MNVRSHTDLTDPAQVLHFLLGTWTLDRQISGLASAAGTATVTGTATHALTLAEEVTVILASGTQLRARQSWEFLASGTGVAILYGASSPQAGQLFQQLSFVREAAGVWRAQDLHLCGPDRYDSTYSLQPPNRMSILHTVDGPRKQYSSHTEYRRIGCLK